MAKGSEDGCFPQAPVCGSGSSLVRPVTVVETVDRVCAVEQGRIKLSPLAVKSSDDQNSPRTWRQ